MRRLSRYSCASAVDECNRHLALGAGRWPLSVLVEFTVRENNSPKNRMRSDGGSEGGEGGGGRIEERSHSEVSDTLP